MKRTSGQTNGITTASVMRAAAAARDAQKATAKAAYDAAIAKAATRRDAIAASKAAYAAAIAAANGAYRAAVDSASETAAAAAYNAPDAIATRAAIAASKAIADEKAAAAIATRTPRTRKLYAAKVSKAYYPIRTPLFCGIPSNGAHEKVIIPSSDAAVYEDPPHLQKIVGYRRYADAVMQAAAALPRLPKKALLKKDKDLYNVQLELYTDAIPLINKAASNKWYIIGMRNMRLFNAVSRYDYTTRRIAFISFAIAKKSIRTMINKQKKDGAGYEYLYTLERTLASAAVSLYKRRIDNATDGETVPDAAEVLQVAAAAIADKSGADAARVDIITSAFRAVSRFIHASRTADGRQKAAIAALTDNAIERIAHRNAARRRDQRALEDARNAFDAALTLDGINDGAGLTTLEKSVLMLLDAGYLQKDIAKALNISAFSVNRRVKSIREKVMKYLRGDGDAA